MSDEPTTHVCTECGAEVLHEDIHFMSDGKDLCEECFQEYDGVPW
jgi:formylmethanofuran dehydrogenase subunit E